MANVTKLSDGINTYDIKDNNAVHKSGDENVGGVKTFTDNPLIKKGSPCIYMQNTAITKGTAPSTTQYSWYSAIYDSTGTVQANKLAQIYHSSYSGGAVDFCFHVFRPLSGSTESSGIRVGYSSSNSNSSFTEIGTVTANAPTPTEDTTSSTQIDTVGARNTKLANYALDNNVVHKSGDETITGAKTVSGTTFKVSNADQFKLLTYDTRIDRGVAPASWTGMFPYLLVGQNNKRLSGLYCSYALDRRNQISLIAYNGTSTDATDYSVSEIEVGYDGNGNPYTKAMTPDASSSTSATNIATVGWVNDVTKSTNVVHRSGDENIGGIKTFSSPINGTIYGEVASDSTKDFIKAKIAGSDYFRLTGGGANNTGYVELATADDFSEPIYIRQYQGNFTTLKRTATILDGSGNTQFPGIVTGNSFTGNLNGDNYIQWGGPNLQQNVSPTDAGCLDDFGHNKAAYWRGLIDAEYTVDGETWIDYGLSSYQKWALTTANGTDVLVGKATKRALDGTLTSDNIANVRARITLHIKDADGYSRFYSALRKIVLNVSQNGASNCKVKVLTRTIENYTSETDTWVDRGTYEVSGWSGWNSIPFISNFGGYDNQTGYNADLRLEFWSETVGASTTTSCLSIKDIRLIGVTNWIVDDFAKTGHLYSISDSKSATFPNVISFSTPATSDNSTKGATTAYVNNKHQVVSTLPASPDADVFYYIPE